MVANSSDMTKHKKSLVPTPTKGKGGGKPGKVNFSESLPLTQRCFLQVSGKSESVDLKDCPLELKEIEAPECPRYTGVLKRGDTEVILENTGGREDILCIASRSAWRSWMDYNRSLRQPCPQLW